MNLHGSASLPGHQLLRRKADDHDGHLILESVLYMGQGVGAEANGRQRRQVEPDRVTDRVGRTGGILRRQKMCYRQIILTTSSDACVKEADC